MVKFALIKRKRGIAMRYGFIGCGHMGGALARAVCRGAGAANVLHFRANGQDLLLAANRETDEIAVYTLHPED